jgi:hypothetical protein
MTAMIRSSHLVTALLLMGASAWAQAKPHSMIRPVTSPVRHAGVYHFGLGTWTRGVDATSSSAWDVVYANTCPFPYYLGQYPHEYVADEGRVPGPNGPVLCDTGLGSRNTGCSCSYEIRGFQIAYCTSVPSNVSFNVGFQDAYVACAIPVTTHGPFTLTGLPGAGTSAQGCWMVTIDLDATSQSFSFAADGASCTWLATGDLATNHLFGWTFENLNHVTNSGTSFAGPLFAGGWYSLCSMVDGTRWDTLSCVGQGGGPAKWPYNLGENGLGMDTQDRFRDDTTVPGGPLSPPSGPGCYFFGGIPPGSFHLRLFADTGCPSLPPGQDFCIPSQSGVMNCPCSNPGAPGHGCDNSSATGGALLTSAGTPSLSAPTQYSVVFTASGEKPTATSILLQAHSGVLPQGVQFGMGVRCMWQSLKRLFVHGAASGIVSAPTPSDATSIPAKSAALGDPITPGEVRLYLFYYRDPILLGGCTGANTFNCTQSQSVLWVN